MRWEDGIYVTFIDFNHCGPLSWSQYYWQWEHLQTRGASVAVKKPTISKDRKSSWVKIYSWTYYMGDNQFQGSSSFWGFCSNIIVFVPHYCQHYNYSAQIIYSYDYCWFVALADTILWIWKASEIKTIYNAFQSLYQHNFLYGWGFTMKLVLNNA